MSTIRDSFDVNDEFAKVVEKELAPLKSETILAEGVKRSLAVPVGQLQYDQASGTAAVKLPADASKSIVAPPGMVLKNATDPHSSPIETAKSNPTPVVRPAGSNISEIQQRNEKIITEGPYKGIAKSEAVRQQVQVQASSLAAQRQNMENAAKHRLQVLEDGAKNLTASKDIELGRIDAHYAEVEEKMTAMIGEAQKNLSDLIARLEYETATAATKREDMIAAHDAQMNHIEAMARAERASLAALAEPVEVKSTAIDPMDPQMEASRLAV